MRILIAVSVVMLACGTSVAEEQLVREIRWSQVQETGQSLAGELQQGDGAGPKEYLVVTNSEDLPMSVALLTLAEPGITATQYAITGSVSYEGVHGSGYLEMWNHFPNGGAYFSKTLGDSGPMGRLRGSSNWRPFSLPFMSDAETGAPNTLELNLVLPGPGTVKLGDSDSFSTLTAWPPCLAPGPGGAIGPEHGSRRLAERFVDASGQLIGTLTSLGIARRCVLALSLGIVVFGVACLALGSVALSVSQPYAVYYPLLLGGGICTIVFGALLPQIRQRYQQIEIRKMASMDMDALHA